MKTITRDTAYLFWANPNNQKMFGFIDECGEFNTTAMGEAAADYFGLMTDEGTSAIELDLFDWAVDFYNNQEIA